MKPCLKLILALPEDDQETFAAEVERAMRMGATQREAQISAAQALMSEIDGERDMAMQALREQHPDLLEPVAAGGADADIRYSADNTREILGRVVDAKNKSLRRVNPASVLERDIATAAKAIEAAIPIVASGEELRAEIPIGPAPHVLHMLGAPMQSMVIHTSIIRKVLTRASGHNHADDFVGVSPREFVEAIYKPAVVLRAAKPGEWELVTDLKNANGQPIMFALMSDAQLPPLANGKRPKVLAIKSAYSRTLVGGGDTILSRIKAGRLAYAEMEKAHSAFIDGWAQFQVSLAEGLRNRTVKDDLALVKFIGDNFKPESSPAGWSDAPAFSRSPGFELPEFGAVAKVQQSLQDRYNRWKQAVDAVRKQGGNVNEANDFYKEEERYWGRVGAQNEAFGREIEDFVRAVQADGLTLQDVAEYVYARHAAERNAYVDSMRSDMQGAGSGMSNDEADSILISAQQSGLEPALQRHANTLYDWIDGTRDVLESNGLISSAERQAWESMFTNYVPLRGLEGKEERKGTGSGFDIRGRESKTLAGRRSQARQIIEQIVQDRTRAYIRAGKNEVLRSFLNFALDNPSPNLWKINAVETKPAVVVDEFGNRLVEERDSIISDDRTVAVKDGGETIYIEIKDKPLLEQMRNMHVENVGKLVGAMLWANRKVGAMLTAFNPVFVVMNGIRDSQAATMSMIDDVGFGGAARMLAGYPRAFAEAFRAQFFSPSALYREYVNAGGTTGYFGLKDLNKTGDELQAIMRNAERSPINPIKMGMAIVKFVEDANSVVEQTARFAMYKAARDSGKTIAQAASISKNGTVNFNRKGTMANTLGAVILFFNPAVQGSARIAQALKSPKVLATLASGTTALVSLALMNAGMGGEDDDEVPFWDKVPKEVKERNIVLMLPPERDERGKLTARYVKIPVAYGYNVFNVMANELADQWRHSQNPAVARKPAESAVRLATAFLSATMPAQALSQGVEDPSALVMLPFSNALGPIAQALANRSGFGRPLYTDYPNERELPDSSKYSPSQAGTLFQKAAERLNEVAGGDKYTSSGPFTDISPGAMENAVRFYGGGIAAFTIDMMNAMYVRQHIERPSMDVKRLPFVKQLYGVIDDENDRWFAYDRMRKAESASQPFDQARRDGDGEAAAAILADKGPIAASGKVLTRIRKDLSDLRKAEMAVINDKNLTDGERYIRLMEISGQVRDVLQTWNKVYADLMAQRKEVQ